MEIKTRSSESGIVVAEGMAHFTSDAAQLRGMGEIVE